MPDTPHSPVIGIDLGGTNINLGVIDAEARVIGRLHLSTQAAQGQTAVLDRLAQAIHDVCDAANVQLKDIAAVGIAAPGAIDMPSGIVLEAPNLKWTNVPLRDELRTRIGRQVVVDNDVNAGIWGEYKLGAARGFRDCLGVWCGTGVGGGLVLDEHLHHGSLHTAGEFGQMTIEPHKPRGQRTIEDYCSRTGISRLVREWAKDFPGSALTPENDDPKYITQNKKLADAWKAGDKLAGKVVEQAAHLLGIGIANVVTLLAIEAVVIGGGVAECLGSDFVKLTRKSFEDHVFPQSHKKCVLTITQLEDQAGLLGAALMARNEHPHC